MNATRAGLSTKGFALAVAAFWVWFTWTCAGEWQRDPDYVHGWVVIPLASYFLWNRLTRSAASPPSSATGIWLLLFALGLCVLPVEVARQAPLYWNVFTWSVYAIVAGATVLLAYLAGGCGWARQALFPLLFLGTAVPWPTAIEQPVTMGLARAIAVWVGELFQVFGTPARIEGTVIVLPGYTVGIAEACSGVRSLQSALMLALAVGELSALSLGRRLALVPISFLIALATNGFRTLALSMAGASGGEARLAELHDPLGWVALILLVAGVVAAGWLMSRSPVDSPPVPVARPRTGNWAEGLALTALVTAGVLAANGWYFFHEMNGAHRESPVLAARAGVELSPLPDYVERLIRPTEGAYVRLPRADDSPATGYHLVWDDRRNNFEALFHRPDVCMPGVGWKLTAPPETARVDMDHTPVDWTILCYERNGMRVVMLWAAWLDGEPLRFSLHTRSSVQQNTLMRLIANGRRKFSYEVAAIMIPFEGDKPPMDRILEASQKMFRPAGRGTP